MSESTDSTETTISNNPKRTKENNYINFEAENIHRSKK